MSGQCRSTFRFVLRKNRLHILDFGLDTGFLARTWWARAHHVRQRCFVTGFVGGGRHNRADVMPANGSNAFVESERSVAIDNNLAIVWDVSKTTPATRPWRDYANDAIDHDPLLREMVYAQTIASVVGRAVYLHRTQRGLSQAALGRLIDMPQPQVARIETGDHTPTAATLLRLCDALGLNLELSIWPRTAKRRTAPHVPHGAIVETTDQLVITIRNAD